MVVGALPALLLPHFQDLHWRCVFAAKLQSSTGRALLRSVKRARLALLQQVCMTVPLVLLLWLLLGDMVQAGWVFSSPLGMWRYNAYCRNDCTTWAHWLGCTCSCAGYWLAIKS